MESFSNKGNVERDNWKIEIVGILKIQRSLLSKAKTYGRGQEKVKNISVIDFIEIYAYS